MKKFVEAIEKCLVWLFVIIAIGILAVDIVFQNVDYYRRRDFVLPIFGFTLLSVGLLAIIFRVYKRNINFFQTILEKSDRIVLIGTFILLGIQAFICVNIFFMTGWDSGILTANADYVANGQTEELWNWYYSRCPNNSLLTAIFAVIFWCVEHLGVSSKMVRVIIALLQCGISSLTGYLLYQCAKKWFKVSVAPIALWILYVFVQGLSPWVIIPYSDAFCLFMPVLLFRLYQLLSNKKYIIPKCIAMGVIAYLGYEIKPMVIIVFIAIVGIELLSNIKEKVKLKSWLVLGTLVISLICTACICKMVNLEKMMGFEINNEANFGLTHYFMMGFNYEHSGVYIQEDADYSESIATNAERQKENIRIAKERIKEFGVIGLLKHEVRKTMVNFNDGTFAWGQEGNFFGIALPIPKNPITKFLRNLYWDNGKYHVVYQTIAELFWMICLIGCACNVFALKKNNINVVGSEYLVMICSLIGIALFVMIFEARARYLYVYIPFYVLVAVKGYHLMYHSLFKNDSCNNSDE